MGFLRDQIEKKAKSLGFEFFKVAKAEKMDLESRRLENWLNKGFHGKMAYMENYFDLRTDPTKIVPNSKSIICLAYNYFTDQKPSDENAPKVSMYAHGKDYHFLLKKKLYALLEYIREIAGDIDGRVFVDSGPVLERDWAKRAGMGWIGKNTLLINPKRGSYFFLAEVILDLELEVDPPMKDYCGTCTRCIEACPTDAILGDGYLLDASRCISYLTIELKENLPEDFQGKMENWMFGCDICQQVCPWNRFSKKHEEPWFEAHEKLYDMTKREWEELSEPLFQEIFRKSAVKRTKFKGLQRNIKFLKLDEKGDAKIE